MPDLEERLTAIEARLARLERLLSPPQKIEEPPSAPVAEENFTFELLEESPPGSPASLATGLLGWGGVTALVLAAAYLIKLGIDLGWLTPARQTALAALGGLILIGTGVALRQADRRYAGLLPAGGLAILFLAVYGAHLYYRLLAAGAAAAAVVLLCLLALWLCHLFADELYALFAVAGSYSAPLLLPVLRGDILGLALYFAAWDTLFCLYALRIGRRRIYLLALYLSLIIFDLIWRVSDPGEWSTALGFQSFQFVLFAACTAAFSMRRRSPLDHRAALAHLPPLLLFYILQYAVLDRHLPSWAPWIALASSAVPALAYAAARWRLQRELPGGRLLLSAYAALVLLHAGYLEAVPDRWQPWAALLIAAVAGAGALRRPVQSGDWPLLAAAGLIYAVNYLRIILHADLDRIAGSDLLVLAFAGELYLAYFLACRFRLSERLRLPLVYAGHVGALAAAVHLFSGRLAVSLCWGALAVAALLFSLWRQDRILGQSSLLVFAASGAKVLLYDLAGAAPLVRIACLLVLGVTLYLGGWLYRKVAAMDSGP